MKTKWRAAVVCMAALTLLAACSAVYPDNLLSADNDIAFVSGDSVAAIEAGTAYGDIITRLGATRDDGAGDGTHMAVYLVDDSRFLYLTYTKLTDKCPSSGAELLEGAQSAPAIRGVVTDISGNADGITMLVEEEPEVDMLMKASVRMDEKTPVVGENGESTGLDAIEKGGIVEVVFDGPVAESYPLQGRALLVTIIDESAQ